MAFAVRVCFDVQHCTNNWHIKDVISKHIQNSAERFNGYVFVCDVDVHPDDDADRVHESQCLRVSGDALHT